MSKAEQIRMCLAEAGFIEGRDYGSICPLSDPDSSYIIIYSTEQYTPALKAAIAKAQELCNGPIYPSEPYRGQFTCGPDPKERRAV